MDGMRIVVTGGAGFLGSHFVAKSLETGVAKVCVLDLLTYAGDLARLEAIKDERLKFIRTDIADAEGVKAALAGENFDAIVHYAAETHVTRSEKDPGGFHRTNVDGTKTLLEAAQANGIARFIHVSTDEVYGSIKDGFFSEGDKLPGTGNATSPYAQSKALADDIALSFADRLDVVVARPTNAFGPWQFPEKAFPRWVTKGIRGEPIPVWGDGLYVRQWLFASDFAAAIATLLAKGVAGEAYNVGPHHDPEITNIALATWISDALGLSKGSVRFTEGDRPDHDRRYAVDSGKIAQLGWTPGDVWDQFEVALKWYVDNKAWWSKHIAESESIYSDLLS